MNIIDTPIWLREFTKLPTLGPNDEASPISKAVIWQSQRNN